MPRLLVVHHSPTASMRSLTGAVLDGARDDLLEGLDVVERPALEAGAEDVLGADGIVLCTPANFGYMSGALKHFFDSTFLEIGGALSDDGSADDGSAVRGSAVRGSAAGGGGGGGRLPFGLVVHGRYDVTGAVRAVLAITGALPWRQGAAVLEVLGEVGDADLEAASEVGATVGALALG